MRRLKGAALAAAPAAAPAPRRYPVAGVWPCSAALRGEPGAPGRFRPGKEAWGLLRRESAPVRLLPVPRGADSGRRLRGAVHGGGWRRYRDMPSRQGGYREVPTPWQFPMAGAAGAGRCQSGRAGAGTGKYWYRAGAFRHRSCVSQPHCGCHPYRPDPRSDHASSGTGPAPCARRFGPGGSRCRSSACAPRQPRPRRANRAPGADFGLLGAPAGCHPPPHRCSILGQKTACFGFVACWGSLCRESEALVTEL